MIRKFLKYFLIPLFIFGLFILIPKSEIYAVTCGWESTSASDCESHIGAFPDICCHTVSGCSSACGNINWYDWCHDTGCQVLVCYDETSCLAPYWWYGSAPNPNDPYGLGNCAHEVAWLWSRQNCSAVDSCLGGADLHCGLCSSTGCSKCGGTYKICCNNVTGAPCSNSCTGSNYSGYCASGCHPHVPELGDGPCATVKVACNGTCSISSDCQSGLSCISGRCRNPSCSSETDCTCPIVGCNQSCLLSACASGLSCISSRCRNPSCSSETDCVCPVIPTNPPTPIPIPTLVGTHRECSGSSCVTVGGAGSNICNSNSDCAVVSCDIGYAPVTVAMGETKTVGVNVYVDPVGAATVNFVEFSSVNPAVATVDVAGDDLVPYETKITGKAEGSTVMTVTALLNSPGDRCVKDIPIVVTRPRAWFQTQGGDVHVQGNLSDKIPSTATDPNLSLELNNYAGVITHLPGGQVSFGQGFSSNDTAGYWVAPSEYKGKPYSTFDFFKKKYAMNMAADNFNGGLPSGNGVYYSSTGQTLSGSWVLGGNRWVIVLVEGNVTIPMNITVSSGSFLAIASSGKITFNGPVAKAQGMFVAETIDTSESNTAFAGEGIFAATTFSLERDFDDARNNTTPVETFIARPDFLMSSYKSKDKNLWWFFQKWLLPRW
jgi:hypothetical protein